MLHPSSVASEIRKKEWVAAEAAAAVVLLRMMLLLSAHTRARATAGAQDEEAWLELRAVIQYLN